MSELLSCPFCGGDDVNMGVRPHFREGKGNGWTVLCADCGGSIGYIERPDGHFYAEYDTKSEAIVAWNSRAAMEYEGWFYLPKPKEGIVDYGEPEITRTENGYKVRQIVDVVDEAARKWGDDLSEYIMRRICEVWNTRTDDYEQAAEYWQRMYEQTFAERTCRDTGENEWHFVCSACGYEQNGYECWNYCPNCGARVVE